MLNQSSNIHNHSQVNKDQCDQQSSDSLIEQDLVYYYKEDLTNYSKHLKLNRNKSAATERRNRDFMTDQASSTDDIISIGKRSFYSADAWEAKRKKRRFDRFRFERDCDGCQFNDVSNIQKTAMLKMNKKNRKKF